MANVSKKISECRAYIADLRKREKAETDPAAKAELQGLQLQWLEVLDSYELVADGNSFLTGLRARRYSRLQEMAQTAGGIGPTSLSAAITPPDNGAPLADLLEVLICTAVEHSNGKARAAFYLSDAAESELRHVVGMPREYARHVDGFVIGEQSLACGLAVATRQPIVTRDVHGEPRWQPWLWLAREFDYRACWSFPIAAPSGRALGSFAIYHSQPHEATPRDLELASLLTRTAATIIARHG